ncbi:hypothetical protein C6501_00520 [Candidatus Poribacteria bacterium]|nr:MAG: hypothetical protein C6501_00520 [Candidatus Poribacteria bacterium]
MNKYQIRFLLDENTSHVIRDGLKRRQPEVEVRVIGSEGVPPISTKDEEILKFLEREGYILVSSNRSTMPIHLQAHLKKGRHIPGILLLRPRVSYQQIIDTLELICLASVPEDFRDQITYIPY